MDAFALRNRLTSDYSDYIRSFIRIQDERIDRLVQEELDDGLLWPPPLLQLNPSFQPGKWIDELVDAGVLHPGCKQIFRLDKQDGFGRPLRLHKHQSDAVEAARTGDSYVLTTGTGSGKSLAYIIPIVDFVLRHGGSGIRAIVVYPTNALANSQYGELQKFLGQSTVTFERYTGQESEEKRQAIQAHPPHILLTNYVMLELILTRPAEKRLVAAARGMLQFLVLDELHTYRGRQGADVAMLIRRVREMCETPQLQCVGTSATLAGGGMFEQQQQEIAGVASRLFGAAVKPERVIGETLRRATADRSLSDPGFVAQLTARIADPDRRPSDDLQAFCADPLSIWIETTFGLATEPGSGRLQRATPISIFGADGAAARLADRTGVDQDRCTQAIQEELLAGYKVKDAHTDFPIFAFRLHQFISRGDTVYASLEPADRRHVTTYGQRFVPGDRERALLPLAFCRECGQEYYVVSKRQDRDEGVTVFVARELTDQRGEDDDETGFLYANPANPWPDDQEEMLERLPEDWVEGEASSRKVRYARRHKLPEAVRIDRMGRQQGSGEVYQFIKTPFSFCLNCGVAYGSRERSDYGKLASLSSEGRSTATTILSLSALRSLRQDASLQAEARKLLSFTDNRQDAALQTGHFNDFVEIGLLRSAVYRAAVGAGAQGLRHDELAQRVFKALNLPFQVYAADPEVLFGAKTQTEAALRHVLAYRIYQDLRRGWRITSPNLEQCGLLEIHYESLPELCEAETLWADAHPALANAAPETRVAIAKTLLDYLRRELAIKVDHLNAVYMEGVQQQSSQRLKEPWALDENERLIPARIAFPRSRKPQDSGENAYVSGRGGFGQYLRRPGVLPHQTQRMRADETELVIVQLLERLRRAGLTEVVHEDSAPEPRHGYQIPASSLIWCAGDGTKPFHDPIRIPRQPGTGQQVNPFFVRFYQDHAAGLQGLRAREHTAQVLNEMRMEREEKFRSAELPLLFCSPTMELGVDIAQLNAVNMRNVPPTPANYAQRSGRAGRSGQPALVFTYCTTGSPHDQYFFKRPQQMVAGAVAPPRLDLANEDLIRAHVHAVWLAETDLFLGTSLTDVLDVSGDDPSLELLPSVRDRIESDVARQRAARRVRAIFAHLEAELTNADWYRADWVDRVLERASEAFDRACDRWRDLYRAARAQRERQHRIVADHSRSQGDRDQAKRLRGEAEAQINLLTETSIVMQSDFYSYRYFASEGFLPGYNFPRLPLSAYIPGRRLRSSDSDEYLNRPRFLAISEFGPRSIIYHEGSRYLVNRVILPVDQRSEQGLVTQRAKLCANCGYLHPIRDGEFNPDLCEFCRSPLGSPMSQLFRMQNVSTRRRDRISSDEEERLRMGYELRTVVRFEGHSEGRGVRTAVVEDADGKPLLELTYGHAATIWRMNLGWRRRKVKESFGFVLDTERGYWARNEEAVEDDPEDAMSNSKQIVTPYVEDRRNCLLIEPAQPLAAAVMASLQPALKNAIQVLYQVEDAELAAEPLPTADERRLILLYEAAEGGAGVLRQVFDDPGTMARIGREALRICHFDPDAGRDQRRAPHAREDCEAACYDCLMSYYNQLDHDLLDRKLVSDLLMALMHSSLRISPGSASRQAHLQDLKARCESELERAWLGFLDAHNLHLPTAAQKRIDACNTLPDFAYDDQYAVIYIDGPDHDFANVHENDARITSCLEDQGYTVIRFGWQKDRWPAIAAQYAQLFGGGDKH